MPLYIPIPSEPLILYISKPLYVTTSTLVPSKTVHSCAVYLLTHVKASDNAAADLSIRCSYLIPCSHANLSNSSADGFLDNTYSKLFPLADK